MAECEPAKPSIDLKFLNITHIPENVNRVWQECENADVILMEFHGESDSTRKDMEKEINLASSSSDSAAKDRAIADCNKYFLGHDFIMPIVRKVISENKEFHFIDSSQEEDTGEGITDTENLRLKSYELFYEGKIKDSFELRKKRTQLMTAELKFRNDTVTEQIKKYIGQPENNQKKFAIIQGGSGHSIVYHYFKKNYPEINSSRTFANGNGVKEFVFPILRRGIFGKISEKDYVRNFVESFPLKAALLSEPDTKREEYAGKISRAMSPEEVQTAFEELIAIENTVKPITNEVEMTTDTQRKSELKRAIFHEVAKTTEIIGARIIENHKNMI